jgi:hypothetical protein
MDYSITTYDPWDDPPTSPKGGLRSQSFRDPPSFHDADLFISVHSSDDG